MLMEPHSPLEGIGTIPIVTVLHQVNNIVAEISHFGQTNNHVPTAMATYLAKAEVEFIYNQISWLALEIGHIAGETSETITHFADGSETISETGLGEAMSLSIGFSPATAYASAYSSGSHVALATAATAAASYDGYADAVAVAMGDVTTATTNVA
jgi:hypothetical protein